MDGANSLLFLGWTVRDRPAPSLLSDFLESKELFLITIQEMRKSSKVGELNFPLLFKWNKIIFLREFLSFFECNQADWDKTQKNDVLLHLEVQCFVAITRIRANESTLRLFQFWNTCNLSLMNNLIHLVRHARKTNHYCLNDNLECYKNLLYIWNLP